jgi:hypothetical protein
MAQRWTASIWIKAIAAGALGAWGLWALARYTAGNLVDAGNGVSFVTRALNLLSGVSPVLPVVVLGLVVTLWALVELTRARGARPAMADPLVRPLLQQALHGTVPELQESWSLVARSMLAVPRWLQLVAAAALVVTCLFAFDPFADPLVTVEGPWFGRFVPTAMLAAQALIVLSLLQFLFLWSKLEALLGRLAWHDGAAAYDRISRDLFPARLLARVPRFMELQTLVAQWRRCVREAGWDKGRWGGVADECLDPRPTFEEEMNDWPDRPWSESTTWRVVVSGAAQGLAALRGERPPAPTTPAPCIVPPPSSSSPTVIHMVPRTGGTAAAAAVQTPADPREDELPERNEPLAVTPVMVRAHEDLVAMAVALLLRDALARLEHNLVFVTAGVLLVFSSHSLFPFQARQGLELLGWAYIGLTFAATMSVLARMKRNEIIGRLSSTTPGKRATWDGEFVLKLAVFGLLPLLTVFATRFPDLGSTLLGWIEPVQKALP